MSVREVTRARYETHKFEAYRTAALAMQARGVTIRMTPWSRAAATEFEGWIAHGRHPDADWDWETIFRRHAEPSRLDMAVWGEQGRLLGLGLATMSPPALTIKWIEGDPRPDKPLPTGGVILTVVDAAIKYAQANGRGELRIHPLNPTLGDMYESVYGFTPHTPPGRGEQPYHRKEV